MKKKKTVIDNEMESIEKLSKLLKYAKKMGGVLAYSGEITEKGGLVMRVTIPVK